MKRYFVQGPWQKEWEEIDKENYLKTLIDLGIYSGHGVGPHSEFNKHGIRGMIEVRK